MTFQGVSPDGVPEGKFITVDQGASLQFFFEMQNFPGALTLFQEWLAYRDKPSMFLVEISRERPNILLYVLQMANN